MNELFPIWLPQFFTTTIFGWEKVFEDDKNKEIILDSLKFLVTERKIEVNAFVIMINHIHLIWQPLFGCTPSSIQASFMKFTANQLKNSLIKCGKIEPFKVNKFDRDCQIWKREPLSIELSNVSMFYQKLEYIHYNPVTAGLCERPEEYYYSSARYYLDGIDDFGILTHLSGN
jgi:REP element-mobilizing transposase RayT